MKHVKPVSKAVLGQTSGILSLLELLISLGLVNVEDLFKKDGNGA